jgi:hypothetical protein
VSPQRAEVDGGIAGGAAESIGLRRSLRQRRRRPEALGLALAVQALVVGGLLGHDRRG